MSAGAAATDGVKQPESAAHKLKTWFEQQVRMRPNEIDLRTLKAKAIAELGNDPAFRAAILEEGIGMILPIIAHKHWQTERKAQSIPAYSLPKDHAYQIADRLSKWYEHVGQAVHKRLGSMNRVELEFAANARQTRLNTELRTVRFERRLAEGLPNDSVTVEEHFQPEELATIWTECFEGHQAFK